MIKRSLAILVLLLVSLPPAAKEGDLYLFHNFYTNHLEGSTYYLREEGELEYQEDNNATGLRYKLSDQLSIGAGYTPSNSYEESSIIAAAEYVWNLGGYVELGGLAGVASGYEKAQNNASGWAIQVGPLARLNVGMFSVSTLVLNMKIFAVNAEIRLGNF